MTLTEFLNGIRSRLAAATKSGWKDAGDWYHDCRVGINMTEDGEFDDEASALIASAPTDLALAVEVIEVMREALEQVDIEWPARECLAKIDALLKGSGE